MTKVKFDDKGKLKTRRKEDMELDGKGRDVDKVMDKEHWMSALEPLEHLMSQMTHTVVI